MKSTMVLVAVAAILAAVPARADNPDQASAEHAVITAYVKYQTGCTPSELPHVRSITWDDFHPAGSDPSGHIGGSGTIHDADTALGGPFVAVLDTGAPMPSGGVRQGLWDIVFEFC